MSLPDVDPMVHIKALGGLDQPIGVVKSKEKKKHAVVGAGITGITHAILLAKAGIKVDVYEMSRSEGGRMLDDKLKLSDSRDAPSVLVEQGAMRFPSSSTMFMEFGKLANHYLLEHFPNPGRVKTLVAHRDNRELWSDLSQPCPGFPFVFTAWSDFYKNGLTAVNRKGKVVRTLRGWGEIGTLLQKAGNDSRSAEQAHGYIQQWLTEFGGMSAGDFFDLVFVKSTRGYQYPGERAMTEKEREAMKCRGLGSGPFRPLEGLSIFFWMNLLITGQENDQSYLVTPEGDDLVKSTGATMVTKLLEYAKRLGVSFHFRQCITGIRLRSNGDYELEIEDLRADKSKSKSKSKKKPKFVDVHTVTFTMTPQSLTHRVHGLRDVLGDDMHRDLRDFGFINATKMYLLVKDPSVAKPNIMSLGNPEMVQCVITDTKSTQFYLLPTPDRTKFVILAMYAWNNDADRIDEMNEEQIFRDCVTSVQRAFTDSKSKRGPDKILLEAAGKSWLRAMQKANSDKPTMKWSLDPGSLGAFSTSLPGQEQMVQRFGRNFLDCGRVQIAGDYVCDLGGWAESGIRSGYFSAMAIIKAHGGTINMENVSAFRKELLAPYNLDQGGPSS